MSERPTPLLFIVNQPCSCLVGFYTYKYYYLSNSVLLPVVVWFYLLNLANSRCKSLGARTSQVFFFPGDFFFSRIRHQTPRATILLIVSYILLLLTQLSDTTLLVGTYLINLKLNLYNIGNLGYSKTYISTQLLQYSFLKVIKRKSYLLVSKPCLLSPV